jgi:hypothetical protein
MAQQYAYNSAARRSLPLVQPVTISKHKIQLWKFTFLYFQTVDARSFQGPQYELLFLRHVYISVQKLHPLYYDFIIVHIFHTQPTKLFSGDKLSPVSWTFDMPRIGSTEGYLGYIRRPAIRFLGRQFRLKNGPPSAHIVLYKLPERYNSKPEGAINYL